MRNFLEKNCWLSNARGLNTKEQRTAFRVAIWMKSPSTVMQSLVVFLLPVLTLSVYGSEHEEEKLRPHFDESYLTGMRAYTSKDWEVASSAMQQAVEDFERYSEWSIKCLKLCDQEKVKTVIILLFVARFFHVFVKDWLALAGIGKLLPLFGQSNILF